MSRNFNTAGPSVRGEHYMIDPLKRIDLPEIESLIADKRYFVLHAPRQTGKTTSLLALMHHLNKGDKYRACYANIEGAQALRHDVEEGIRTTTAIIGDAAQLYLGDGRLHAWTEEIWRTHGYGAVLTGLLARWSQNSDRPVVLMLDEVDALVGDTLVSLLRQIRAGYAQRPGAFPQTVILCGLRDVKDYRIHTSNKEIITGGSAFNIKTKSLRLGNFTREETVALWQEHQQETGQLIHPIIFPELWEDTRGQPWLVNALGYEVTWEDREVRDRSKPITLERYHEARERLIQARATHLDQLTDKLREDRVRKVISDILRGAAAPTFDSYDLDYVEDLGLIVTKPEIRIANRIYQEVVPRELTRVTQLALQQQTTWYVRPDGSLDIPKLLVAFQQNFRENFDSYIGSEPYREAGAQLLLQTFLQRIFNGDGRIERESAVGSGRVDLYARWPRDRTVGFHGPVQRAAFELKVVRDHDGLDATLAKGLAQLSEYADRTGADESHLVVFDQRPGRTWSERIWQRTEKCGGREIQIWGV